MNGPALPNPNPPHPSPLTQLEKALEVYQEMLRQNMDRSVITYSSLISACEKAGQVRRGWQHAMARAPMYHQWA